MFAAASPNFGAATKLSAASVALHSYPDWRSARVVIDDDIHHAGSSLAVASWSSVFDGPPRRVVIRTSGPAAAAVASAVGLTATALGYIGHVEGVDWLVTTGRIQPTQTAARTVPDIDRDRRRSALTINGTCLPTRANTIAVSVLVDGDHPHREQERLGSLRAALVTERR